MDESDKTEEGLFGETGKTEEERRKEKARESRRKYKQKKKQKMNAMSPEEIEREKEKKREQARKRYQEKWEAMSPEEREEARERQRQYTREYRRRPGVREKVNARQRKRFLANKEQEYAKRLKRQRTQAHQRQRAFRDMYGDKCSECGYSDTRALTLDHVRFDGAEDRKKLKNQREVYKHAISEYMPERYRVLCCNCQRIDVWKRTYLNRITPSDEGARESWVAWSIEFMQCGLKPVADILVFGPHAPPDDNMWGEARCRTVEDFEIEVEFATKEATSILDIRDFTVWGKKKREPFPVLEASQLSKGWRDDLEMMIKEREWRKSLREKPD